MVPYCEWIGRRLDSYWEGISSQHSINSMLIKWLWNEGIRSSLMGGAPVHSQEGTSPLILIYLTSLLAQGGNPQGVDPLLAQGEDPREWIPSWLREGTPGSRSPFGSGRGPLGIRSPLGSGTGLPSRRSSLGSRRGPSGSRSPLGSGRDPRAWIPSCLEEGTPGGGSLLAQGILEVIW